MNKSFISQLLIALLFSTFLSSNCLADTFQNELSILKDIPKSHMKRQHSDADVLIQSIVQGKKDAIDVNLRVIDAIFLEQFPDGSIKDMNLTDEVYFISSLSRAFEALKENQLLWINYKIKIQDYYPRIQLALEFLYQNRDKILGNDSTPDQLLINSNLYFFSSKLLHKNIHLDLARSLQSKGLALFKKDSKKQCMTLLMIMQYVTAYPTQSLYKTIQGAETWEIPKVSDDGSVTGEDSTEALQMFDYYAALFTDVTARDIAKKIYRRIATLDKSKSKKSALGL